MIFITEITTITWSNHGVNENIITIRLADDGDSLSYIPGMGGQAVERE